MLPGRRRRNARGRSRVGWLLLLAVGVSCSPPGRGGPTPQATSGVTIRINQLGYRPEAPKRAVVCALDPRVSATFVVVDERNRLLAADEYAPFNTGFIVYHDDVGDYSTNEPIMDGTANLAYVLAAWSVASSPHRRGG